MTRFKRVVSGAEPVIIAPREARIFGAEVPAIDTISARWVRPSSWLRERHVASSEQLRSVWGSVMRASLVRRWHLFLSCFAATWIVGYAPALGQKAGFVPPPRTIADITAILDQEKPDPAKHAKAQAEANAEPTPGADRAILKDFYFRRAQARHSVGRLAEAIADCKKAAANSSDYLNEGSRIEIYQETLMRLNEDYRGAIALLERILQRIPDIQKGRGIAINLRIAINLLRLGEVNKAEVYVKRNIAFLAQARSEPNAGLYLSSWEAQVEEGKAYLSSARGRFAEAEGAFLKAEALYRAGIVQQRSWPVSLLRWIPRIQSETGPDFMAVYAGMAKSSQGRQVEAELDLRRGLLGRLKSVGKYHSYTVSILARLSWILNEQARANEGEALARASIEILDAMRFPHENSVYVYALSALSGALFFQRRYEEAKKIYDMADASVSSWRPERSMLYRAQWARIFSHYYTAEIDKGISIAKEAYEWDKFVKGENHFSTAFSRATFAAGLAFAKRDAEAIQEYKAAIPVLLDATNDADDEDATVRFYADRRFEIVLEPYIALLAGSNIPNSAEEGLRVVEAMRSRSVRNALSASAVRAAARTPALADIVRKEQDLQKQVLAQAALLNNVLAGAPEQRQGSTVTGLQRDLEKLRNDRQNTRREIDRRFPEYARLISPVPVAVDEIRTALKSDESLLSFYFGHRGSFVWAVPKEGTIAFARVPLTAQQLEARITALRAAFDLKDALTIADFRAFDVVAAYELYSLLLKPVEQGWHAAKNLLVVTNGALGMLPLGLLPTEPAKMQAMTDGEAYFMSYRKVAWLARTHATVTLPSAGSLRTLRSLPAPTAKRDPIIGFGDPIFSAEQASEVATARPTSVAADARRGVAAIRLRASVRTREVRSAKLSSLPRLPDTADELRSVAAALHADPVKVLHLRKDANEKTVKELDLSRYRIVAFATHGLVPGDLDGLMQPALALTAPEVAGIDGDGLLTVDEILSLKLNADWVVLSACNTAAAAGAGADAVSGLGRAFFYAGSRALLVTNWSVESVSARELVADVFRRQTDNPVLTRAEALRQAMIGLMENGEAKNASGKTLFTYAHPLFWAPYTIVGDGG